MKNSSEQSRIRTLRFSFSLVSSSWPLPHPFLRVYSRRIYGRPVPLSIDRTNRLKRSDFVVSSLVFIDITLSSVKRETTQQGKRRRRERCVSLSLSHVEKSDRSYNDTIL